MRGEAALGVLLLPSLWHVAPALAEESGVRLPRHWCPRSVLRLSRTARPEPGLDGRSPGTVGTSSELSDQAPPSWV